MDFFADTADVSELRLLGGLGLLDGVTTNPSLIAKSGRRQHEVIAEICAISLGPVSAEVVSTASEAMTAEGKGLAAIASNVVVKVPLTEDGLAACRALVASSIKVNVTLCFSLVQAIVAAKAGATYISPFVGRLDDINLDGIQLIRNICQWRSKNQPRGGAKVYQLSWPSAEGRNGFRGPAAALVM